MEGQIDNPPPAGTAPLTLEAARGLLTIMEDAAAPAADAGEGAPVSTAAAVLGQPADEADAAAPGDDAAAPSDGNEDADGGEPDEPAIAPPASWRASEKEAFKRLPREIQAVVAGRERDRERAINEAMRGAAETRKAAEAERAAYETERRRLQQEIAAIMPALEQQIGIEFADIRTPADVVALAESDPARYALWRAKQDALQFAQREQSRLSQEAAQEEAAAIRDLARREIAALLDKRPELKDRDARARFNRELRDYALSIGYSPAQYDGNLSHLNLLVLEKAMLYDRAQKAKAEALARPVPRVERPGTAGTKAERAAEERAQKLKRLERSGRIEDAVGLLRN